MDTYQWVLSKDILTLGEFAPIQCVACLRLENTVAFVDFTEQNKPEPTPVSELELALDSKDGWRFEHIIEYPNCFGSARAQDCVTGGQSIKCFRFDATDLHTFRPLTIVLRKTF